MQRPASARKVGDRPKRTVRVAIAVSVLLVAACHDSPRENPLDPVLTPPVELTVALDDTAGTATLTWTPYSGDQSFAEYRVLRQVSGQPAVDTLAILSEMGNSNWTDTSMAQQTPYLYRVSVVNTAGLEVSSNDWVTEPLVLPAVPLQARFDSRTATATLTWTPYRGGQFSRYQLWRRAGSGDDQTTQLVFQTADSTVSTYVDSQLVGATEYRYQVVVVTDRGEEVPGPEASGGIHLQVAEWPLELESSSSVSDQVRLYSQSDGSIIALVAIASGGQAQSRYFTRDGQLVQTQTHGSPLAVMSDPRHSGIGWALSPTGFARCLDPEGQVRLAVVDRAIFDDRCGLAIIPLAADGTPLQETHEPFADALVLAGQEATVLGQIGLVLREGASGFGRVEVTEGGQVVFSRSPELDESAWDRSRWPASGPWFHSTDGQLVLFGDFDGSVLRRDPSWSGFSLKAEVWTSAYETGIQIGGDEFSRLTLSLAWGYGQTRLRWEFSPPPGIGLAKRDTTLATPFMPLGEYPYELGLEVQAGTVRATIQGPPTWRAARVAEHASLATIGHTLLATVFDQAFSIDEENRLTALAPFDSWVGELRAWQWVGERSPRAGVCLPEAGQVLFGPVPVSRAGQWRSAPTRQIGPLIDREVGFLNYPLSLDAGPDGRLYVLDAGNARIVVLDRDGRYLTQWGGPGSEAGRFDFGSGNKLLHGLNFAGSICVDDEGFIYVADVFNHRIQKFAP